MEKSIMSWPKGRKRRLGRKEPSPIITTCNSAFWHMATKYTRMDYFFIDCPWSAKYLFLPIFCQREVKKRHSRNRIQLRLAVLKLYHNL